MAVARFFVDASPAGHPIWSKKMNVLICGCSLSGTDACLSCSRYIEFMKGTAIPNKKQKRITKTYEYDDEGRVIKETIVEEAPCVAD